MNISIDELEASAVYQFDQFSWDASTRSFSGDMRGLRSGFSGEHWDGENIGLGIVGRTGEMLYFSVAQEVMCDDDMVDYWVLQPSCARGRALIAKGVIYNS